MKPAQIWWLDNTAEGRRLQRRILPESARLPRARAEATDERNRDDARRCLLERGHRFDHVFPTRKPIFDRMKDGEFREQEGAPQRELRVPGVTVPANRPRCETRLR